ncbi:MAG: transporter substrate-binding domain-containing protein [Rhodobacteraceae bacterium]|nr:transporter substrate-binding domain-containing protein [Paracoccaceae bacterium]
MSFMKSIAVAAAVLAAPIAAHAESILQEVLNTGVLKVGTTGDWNPMTMKDVATDSYTGYDIDVMTQLAADLGVEVEFVPADWRTLVSGISAGTYHMTGSASVTPARAKVAGYSQPYFSLGTVPLVNAKDAERFKDWDDLNAAGVKVAATLGTTQEQQVKSFFPDAEHIIVDAPARDFQEVLAGRADAHITSNVEAMQLVKRYPQLMIVPVSEPRARALVAMLLPQDDQVWINYVNTWIAAKTEAGFFDELAVKWGVPLE